MTASLRPFRWAFFPCLLLLAACGPRAADPPGVTSRLHGVLTVSAEVDSIPDYSGFEVLVAFDAGDGTDTLGHAVSDAAGSYAVDVTAAEPGVYPLTILRRGTVLARGEYVVARGDTARLDAEFPLGNRPLRIRSAENAAWSAFRNTRAQYNASLLEALQGDGFEDSDLLTLVQRTATILWSMRQSYAGTLGSELASAEAVAVLGGWDDSLAVVRAREIQPGEAGYADAARIARLSQARRQGPEAGLALVRAFRERTADARERARLQQELVLAFLDLNRPDSARDAARDLVASSPGTVWAEWGERALYELENLQPGMEAPAFGATTVDGRAVASDSLRGRWLLLEFYAPQQTVYQREIEDRAALYAAASEASFQLVSFSVEPDTLLNEAFREGRDLPGLHVVVPGGLQGELARTFNVNVLPTRYLIGPDGRIAGKYVGASMAALSRDVLALVTEATVPSESP